jgi:integrase
MAGRRNDGEGTLETTSTGKLRYRGWVSGVRVSSRSFDAKKAAYNDFRRAVREAKARQSRPAPSPTDPAAVLVADYCQALLKGRYTDRLRDGSMSARTWALYESIVANHLDGAPLGEMALRGVEPEHVEAWARGLRSSKDPATPMGDATRLRYLGFLSGVFEVARRSRLVGANPVRDAEKPRVDPDDVEFRIYSLAECDEILALIGAWEDRQDAARPPHVRGRLVLAAHLGLHGFGPAEMCGLRREDLVDGGLKPRRQGQGGKIVERLKARRRKGWVPLDDALLALVEASGPGLLLRADADGTKAVGDNNLRRSFHAALQGTAYEGLTPYDLRHTFAMRLLEEGVDVQTAAELMRNTTEVFLRRYVRSRESLKREAVRKASRGRSLRPTQGTDPSESKAA